MAQWGCAGSGAGGPGPGPGAVSWGRDALGHRPGPRGFRTVIIDAGHGGVDSGAISRTTGQKEKDLALDTALRLERMLAGRFRVVQLRRDDRFIDLDQRVAMADRNDGAIFLSLHYNHGPAHVAGPETYYWRVDSYSLARRIQAQMEGVAPRSGSQGLVRRRLRLTRNPSVPSVLVEFGYLSNPAEARRCADPAYRDRLAAAVARAVIEQAAMGDVGMGQLPPPLTAPPSRPTDPPGT
jgi:N-acetylmuramoyl-L-alanine amidase